MINQSHAATIVPTPALQPKYLLCDCGEQFNIQPTQTDPWYSPDWEVHVQEAKTSKASKTRTKHKRV